MKEYASPDEEDVLQIDDDDVSAIVVEVGNTVRTQLLPTRAGGLKTVGVDTNGVKILNRDEKRRSATILSFDQDIYLGHGQHDVINGAGACLWPTDVPLVLESSDELWAASVTATTKITVIQENWAF